MKLLLGAVAILLVVAICSAAVLIGAITHLAQEVRRGTDQILERIRGGGA